MDEKKEPLDWAALFLSPVVMWHVVRQDNGELDESAYDLLAVVFKPGRLVNQFLLAFLRDGIDIGGCIVEQMLDDFLRMRVVATHQVAAAGIAVHFDAAVVLVKDFAILGADGDGQVEAFVIVFGFHVSFFFDRGTS